MVATNAYRQVSVHKNVLNSHSHVCRKKQECKHGVDKMLLGSVMQCMLKQDILIIYLWKARLFLKKTNYFVYALFLFV